MKRVVKEVETVDIKDISEDKIYALVSPFTGYAYKAGRTHDDKYIFFCIQNSNYNLSGVHYSLNKLIASVSDAVYEFDNVKEFAEWILKRC